MNIFKVIKIKTNFFANVIIIATMSLSIITGCTKKQTDCFEDGCPCGLICEENFAPEGDGYSRTNYNDMDVFLRHFRCHAGTIGEAVRNNDTVMVSGWMYRLDLVGDFGTDTTPHNPMTILTGDDKFFLTGDSNQMDASGGSLFVVVSDTLQLRKIIENFDEFLHSKLYVKGNIYPEYHGCSCCSVGLILYVTYIDIIPFIDTIIQ